MASQPSTPAAAGLGTPRTMVEPRPTAAEPLLTLPTGRLLQAVVLSNAAAAGGWTLVCSLFGFGNDTITTGVIGVALVAAVTIAGVFAIVPWMAKPASITMMLWLVADVFGMLLTLAGAFLLYSATSLSSRPLLLGVVVAYFLTLLGKVIVAALHVRRHLP